MENLKYPIGRFQAFANISSEDLNACIDTIASFPKALKTLLSDVDASNISNTYRPGGWTIGQLVHHCADSHMHAYLRTKLTIENPGLHILPYDEAFWATMPDTKSSLDTSVQILEGLHHRWSVYLKSLDAQQLKSYYAHPEYGTRYSLEEVIQLYAWHGRHHLAHIEIAKAQ